jgi:flagellar biosynthetic protein FlhB
MSDSNKTEKPTSRRRQKAREKGQIARTRDLSGLGAVIAAIVLVGWQGSAMVEAWRGLLQSSLNLSVGEVLEPSSSVLFTVRWQVVRWIAPAMLAAWGVAAFASVAQGGFVFAPEALAPKAERFNPASKIQQMFSITSLSSLLKSLPPAVCVIYLAYSSFRSHWTEIVQASNVPLGSVAHLALSLIIEIGWKSLTVFLVLACIDYFLTWRKHESDLMMSQQEIREEMKETDGNPQIKGRIRRLQRQVRRRQMLKETEKATVVIVNPTHFAIALQYLPTMRAPVVLAKGRDHFAQEIKDVARWHNIPVMENPPLAQALYRLVSVGQEIPAKLYTAVAEILALVYRAQAQTRPGNRPQGNN